LAIRAGLISGENMNATNRLKSVSLALAASLLSGAASAAGSAKVPLNGTYNSSSTTLCNDGSNNVLIGAVKYTPNTKADYQSWLASIGLTNPVGNKTYDQLGFIDSNFQPITGPVVETPIQWGKVETASMYSSGLAPGGSATSISLTGFTPWYFLVTKYPLPGDPSPGTGYLLYSSLPNWGYTRTVFDKTTSQAASASSIGTSPGITNPNATCVTRMDLNL
jgi:hypothetical protein